jgi:hypothetical protein
MYKRAMIIIAAIFILIMAVNALLGRYVGSLNEAPRPASQESPDLSPKENEKAASVQEPVGRVPDDPAKLGIVVLGRMDRPTGPDQWAAFMKKIFDQSGALKTREGQAVLRRMQMRPEQYKATLKRLDEEVSKAELAFYRKAMDPSLERRLEVLYQMKALSHVFEKYGIVNAGVAASPAYGQSTAPSSGEIRR